MINRRVLKMTNKKEAFSSQSEKASFKVNNFNFVIAEFFSK